MYQIVRNGKTFDTKITKIVRRPILTSRRTKWPPWSTDSEEVWNYKFDPSKRPNRNFYFVSEADQIHIYIIWIYQNDRCDPQKVWVLKSWGWDGPIISRLTSPIFSSGHWSPRFGLAFENILYSAYPLIVTKKRNN